MALTWDVSKVENYLEVTTHPDDPDKWHPVTEALIWNSYYVGMPSITALNVDEFVNRVQFYERVFGPLLHSGDGTGRPLTREDIVSHIGFRTNASFMTDAKFRAHVWSNFKKEQGYRNA